MTVLEPDECQRCYGVRGGVKGNENIINGIVLCDYCSADDLIKEITDDEKTINDLNK